MVPFLLAVMSLGAQNKMPVYQFPCNGKQTSLTSQQKHLADSLYYSLAQGDQLQIELLSADEKKAEAAQISALSYQRAALLLQHCYNNKISRKDFYAEITPFAMPNVVRTNDLTLASSKSLGKRSSTAVVFTKSVSMATSQPAVDFDADFTKELQEFQFYASDGIDTWLTSGTRIFIPANSLQQINGQAPNCEKLTLRVSEYLEMDAIALKAMTTTASGKKLQTAGMWYIDVLCNGKPLVMKAGKQYLIEVAMTGDPKDMRVFTGKEKNGLLDWKEETDSKVIKPGENSEKTDSLKEYSEEVDNDYEGEGYEREVVDAVFQKNNAYGLQLNDFGWINCDAFDQTQQLTDIFVQGDISDKTNVMLVYGKRKSVLPGYLCEDGKSVKFSNIAADEPAMLVVFKKENDKGAVTKFTQVIVPGQDKSIVAMTTASTSENLRNEIRAKLSDL